MTLEPRSRARTGAWCVLEPSGAAAFLAPGDWIGRGHQAALRVNDARVSEAHAMVSLRGGTLWLLALRGRLQMRGRTLSEVPLNDDTRVELADGLWLCCEGIDLPDEVVGVRVNGGPPQVLNGTTSVFSGPPARLRAGFDVEADAQLWPVGNEWTLSSGADEPRTLEPGTTVRVGAAELTAEWVPLAVADQTRTRPTIRGPVQWIVTADGVRLDKSGHAVHEISGIPGRILSALLLDDGSLHWMQLCSRVWPEDQSRLVSLRNRLDVGLVKVRERLREAGATEVRVAMDGAGHVRLVLPDVDRVEKAMTLHG